MPFTGGGVLLPPPQPANKSAPTRAAGRRNFLAREFFASSARLIIANAMISISRDGAGRFGTRGNFPGTKPELRAVVVTVSVVPLIEQVPCGIVQLALSVGGMANPVTVIGAVMVLPAGAGGGGCGTTTAGFAVNVAVTLVFAVSANMHTVFVLPAQAPAQLVNVAFAAGTAVSVIDVPEAKLVPDGVC